MGNMSIRRERFPFLCSRDAKALRSGALSAQRRLHTITTLRSAKLRPEMSFPVFISLAADIATTVERGCEISAPAIHGCLRNPAPPPAFNQGKLMIMRIRRLRFFGALSVACMLLASNSLPAHRLAEGSEIEFGGEGKGRGKFGSIKDMAFDSKNNLYVLDGVGSGKDVDSGNGLVQKFDNAGRFLSEFSVIDAKLGNRKRPRVSLWTVEDTYSSLFLWPASFRNTTRRASLLRSIGVKQASAVTVRKVKGKEQIVVAPTSTKKRKCGTDDH